MEGTVAVTGATGFIGRALLQRLQENHWRVRALTRRPRLNTDAIHWVSGDLDDRAALRELLVGASAVVHCAGAVRGRSARQFNHTNVAGTENLVKACLEQDAAPRFLLMSSLAARQPELSWYANSKRMAEQVLADRAQSMPWAAFRPTAVYGPGDRELLPLFRFTRRGTLPLPGRINTRVGLLHVTDLVAAIGCWLAAPEPVSGIFELDDGRPGGYDRESLAAIAQAVWNRPVRVQALPARLILLAATVNLGLACVLRYAPMLTPGKVRELLHPDWVCDNTPLLAALPDWQPTLTPGETLPHLL
ncbi:MAG: NAD(P)-dependent oxidoreductase [Pseudomonadales bacterium]|nr:NAD(P)-dependent oxidoreductase [Pseudomonadales bacterium]